MRVAWCGNCAVDGIEAFMKRALPHHEHRRMPHLATFLGEYSEEQIAELHAWADIVFYHTKHDNPQNYPTKNPKVPLSVWFQSSYFIRWADGDDWKPVEEHYEKYGLEAAINFAPEADMNYLKRWDHCYARMQEKEEQEGVPKEIRISPYMTQGREVWQQHTANHPNSLVFREWTFLLCKFLGEKPGPDTISFDECIANPNIAGLPCAESATSAARRILGLSWGGQPIDDESGRLCASEYFAKQGKT
jgi:hypothetical protein